MNATVPHGPGAILAERCHLTVVGVEGHDLKAACIACDSSDAMRVDVGRGVAQCFSCGSKWSPYRLAEDCIGHDGAVSLMEELGIFERRKQQRQEREQPRGDGPETIPFTADWRETYLAEIAELKGCTVAGFKAFAARVDGEERDALFYRMRSREGEPCVVSPSVVFPMFGPDGKRCSTFRLSHRDPKGRNARGKPTGLFLPGRRPESGETWLLCEGVKDAAALSELGYNAAGLPGSRLRSEFAPLFSGVDAILVPDLDRAGVDGTRETARTLQGVAKSVRVATLPGEMGSGVDVRDVLRSQGPDAIRAAIDAAGPVDQVAGEDKKQPVKFELLTSDQFFRTEYRDSFLVKSVLVERQPAILGGPHKVLKTAIALDLAISLGTGKPFLGQFKVRKRARPLVFSGESGEATIQRVATKIAHAKGVHPIDSGILWGFELPQIAIDEHLLGLVEVIQEHQVGVVLIDPAYLCLLAGDTKGLQASNVFDMGPLLLGLSDVGKATGATIILIHHCRKSLVEPYKPPELVDLSMAGFAEWARQWALVGRREPYQQGSGEHRLWFNVGGSAGHSGLYAVDVNEGTPGDDFDGMAWHVGVSAPDEARQDAAQRKRERDSERRASRADECRKRLLETLLAFPEGETVRELRIAAGLNPDDWKAVFPDLLKEGVVIPCKIRKTNNREYTGYRLSDSQFKLDE